MFFFVVFFKNVFLALLIFISVLVLVIFIQIQLLNILFRLIE